MWRAHKRAKRQEALIVGYVVLLVGTAIWLYGYFVPGNPSLIDWRAHTPWWIADFLPNIESEIGMVLMLLSMVPTYWPRSRVSLSDPPGGVKIFESRLRRCSKGNDREG
jgi:hypothetical protein